MLLVDTVTEEIPVKESYAVKKDDSNNSCRERSGGKVTFRCYFILTLKAPENVNLPSTNGALSHTIDEK
eukprot:gene12202-13341_t